MLGTVVAVVFGLWLMARLVRQVEGTALEAVEPAPVVPKAVLGLTPSIRRPVPVSAGATLVFRGFVWTPRGGEDEKGRITFVREVAVDGRVAEAEVTVLARELIKNADGTYVLGDR